jgi:hypothetical protein
MFWLNPKTRQPHHLLLLLVFALIATWGYSAAKATFQGGAEPLVSSAKPAPAPARWLPLIGEYGPDENILYVLERDGKLSVSFKRATAEPLKQISRSVFSVLAPGSHAGQRLVFKRNQRGRVTQLEVDKVVFERRQVGPEEGATQ